MRMPERAKEGRYLEYELPRTSLLLGTLVNRDKRKGRGLAVPTHSSQDPAPEHEANFLLPNFWLSVLRPLPARLPRPCCSVQPSSLRSSPSPTRPLRPSPVLRRTRRPPR